jgi:hypothetical protein
MDCLRPASHARRPRRIAAAALILAALATALPASAGPGATPPADAVQRAKELHQKGRKAYKEGNLGAAYEAYLAAWNLQKTYDIAANLAGVELATARFRDAADHVAYALANLPVSGDADAKRPVLTDMLKQAKAQIGTLTVRVSADGATVSVDGRVVGTSPVPDEIYLDPGEHTVSASLPSGPATEQKVRLEKGGASLITLTVTAGGTGDTPKPPAASTGPSPITIAGFVTAGLGLAAGTGLAIMAKKKGDDADSKYQALQVKGPTACAGTKPSSDCVALHDTRAAHDTFANAALWTFVGAGLVTAGTLVYTFAAPRPAPPPAKAGLAAVPVVTPDGAGVLIRGSF